MARAIWTGTISFGLVTVPVKLYSAVNRKTVRFHQLNRSTGSRIAMRRVDPSTEDEVPYEEIVKGYELSPDRYVVVEPNELEALQPEKGRTIDILDFVDLAEIDPVYYDHQYYLAPGTGGAKPYKLLLEAMHETGKVGIATVVIRAKEQLVAVRPLAQGVLGMATMVFADEIVEPARIDELTELEQVDVNDRELAIAEQLVESLAADFDPTRYRDSYREEVLSLIERKAAGEEIAVQPPVEEAQAPAPDLMAALKASLDAAKAKPGHPEPKATGREKAKPAKPKPKAKSDGAAAPVGRKRSPAKR
jgi:DNA end-binding protein Ku